jgi:broad specificity phosphatase PhoE
VPLDATGLAQAAALAVALAAEPFEVAVSSDLARANQTAAAILRGRDVPLSLDPRWREMQFGAWEGLRWSEIAARFPEAAGQPNAGGRFVTPTGGESFAAVSERVRGAVTELGERHPGGRVLVATHAGPLHALLSVLLGEDEAAALRVRFGPASVTRLRLRGGTATLLALNQTYWPPEKLPEGRSASETPQSGGRG